MASSRVLAVDLGFDLLLRLHSTAPRSDVPAAEEAAAAANAVTVQLIDGQASVRGVPLVPFQSFVMTSGGLASVSITSLADRTRIQLEGTVAPPFVLETTVAVTDGTPDAMHALLQEARLDAARRRSQGQSQNRAGPVVFIVGSVDKGKSTLCKSLINRSVLGADAARGVAFVDLDVGQSDIMPGSVSTVFVPPGEPLLLPPSEFTALASLSFFYGDKTVTPRTLDRYLDLIAAALQCITEAGAGAPEFEAGGVIVNTMGWVEQFGLEILRQALDVAGATHVIAVDAAQPLRDALDAAQRASFRGLVVWHVARNPFVSSRDAKEREGARSARMRQYFCGTDAIPLRPVQLVLSLSDVVLLDAVSRQPIAAVPGAKVKQMALAAVSSAVDETGVEFANVAGYVVILEVGRSTLTVLSPSPGPLPSRFLLVSPTVSMLPRDLPVL